MRPILKLVVAAASDSTRQALLEQLKGLDFVSFQGVVTELSEAHKRIQAEQPDVILVEMTGREIDAALFIEAISTDPESPAVLFALHQEMDHRILLDTMRRGAKEFIQYPEDKSALETALRRYHNFLSRITQAAPKPVAVSSPALSVSQNKLVSVFSAKGGSGGSTVAVNLAHELRAITGKPVVLFDLDQVFNNTAVMLNLKPHYAIGDLARNEVNDIDAQVLAKLVVQHESGLHLVVGSKNVLDDNDMIPPALLERVVDYLTETYTYVVVDLPSHVLDPYHQYLVERATEVLLVSGLDVPGLYRSRQYIDLARQYLEGDKLKLVLNRWNLRAAYGMSNKSLEEEFHYPIYCRLVNDWELNVEAMSLGKVFSAINPNAELVKSFQKLARLIAGLEEQAESQPSEPKKEKSTSASPQPGSGGLLNKLFNPLGRGDKPPYSSQASES
ncbi:MAG: AAA family ATPase [Candidatus Melainabacteria bacterium]|nr:AAA family ATPase [Candidatus Melainabacteria bacterium]